MSLRTNLIEYWKWTAKVKKTAKKSAIQTGAGSESRSRSAVFRATPEASCDSVFIKGMRHLAAWGRDALEVQDSAAHA
jgi:hypothetical protein